MTIAPSRLLSRLDADIAAATDLVSADCLRAERAAYIARQGHLAEASKELEAIRLRHRENPNAEVAAWVSLGEGIQSYFESETNPRARDKLMRALALSSAIELRVVQANSLAWLMQLEYSRLDFGPLRKYAEMAIRVILPEDTSAASRLFLVFAQSSHLAGAMDSAEGWYKKARKLAMYDGDEATVLAIVHNMAWLFMSDLRRSVLTLNESGSLLSAAKLGSESYLAANQLFQDKARCELVPILRLQIMSLSGAVEEALQGYENWLDQSSASVDLGRLSATVNADLAWCYARTQNFDLALRWAQNAEACINEGVQIDERAAAYSLLHNTYWLADKCDLASHFARLARSAWNDFRDLQDQIRSTMKILEYEYEMLDRNSDLAP